ncbi:MAG: cephalosporin hydroxylase family protein, partial [bacterium]|nr:cephalosporin hydroxylase family protein [bacterium]
VVNDGIMKNLFDVPRGRKEWLFDNPYEAIKEFISKHPEFEIEDPKWLFNESYLRRGTTYWPCGWIKRKK